MNLYNSYQPLLNSPFPRIFPVISSQATTGLFQLARLCALPHVLARGAAPWIPTGGGQLGDIRFLRGFSMVQWGYTLW